MGQIQLLDCTLRDGGYLNDWAFGHNNMVTIYERLVSAGLDIVEIGFLDDRRIYDWDRSILPDTASVEKTYGMLDRKDTMIVGMTDQEFVQFLKDLRGCPERNLGGALDG